MKNLVRRNKDFVIKGKASCFFHPTRSSMFGEVGRLNDMTSHTASIIKAFWRLANEDPFQVLSSNFDLVPGFL